MAHNDYDYDPTNGSSKITNPPASKDNGGQEKQWVMDREAISVLKEILTELKFLRLHLRAVTGLEE